MPITYRFSDLCRLIPFWSKSRGKLWSLKSWCKVWSFFSYFCQHQRTDYSQFSTHTNQPWSRLICAWSPHPLKSGLSSTPADGGYTSQNNFHQHRGRWSYPGTKLNSVLHLGFLFTCCFKSFGTNVVTERSIFLLGVAAVWSRLATLGVFVESTATWFVDGDVHMRWIKCCFCMWIFHHILQNKQNKVIKKSTETCLWLFSDINWGIWTIK